MSINLSRPRPVLTSAGVAGLVTSLAGVLTFLGYDHASAHLSDSTSAITAVVIGAVGLGGHLLAALHSQAQVTPVAKAQDHDGMPLVRADVATQALAVVASAPVAEDNDLDGPLGDPLDAPADPAPAPEPIPAPAVSAS